MVPGIEYYEEINLKMEATQTLMAEHRVIERVLRALESATAKLAAGEAVRPEFFLEASAFIAGFADGCHHKKEEGVLFPAMQAYGIPSEGGPIGVMLADHELGRKYNQAMRAAAQSLQSGDANARQQIVEAAHGYINLLRGHILKEDMILFPIADKVIPLPQQEQVWLDFEHVEHAETGEGVHEKYLALAESLEREAFDQIA
jgi:hemerythrin-like domain-containing protein